MGLKVSSLQALGVYNDGDPLPPLLFVFVMEALGRMFFRAEEGGFLSRFSIKTNTYVMKILHSLFTDDTLIMCCARPEKLRYLRFTLLLFKADSVLKINLGKSKMMGEVANMGALADTLGCKMQTLLSKYLGLPLRAQFKAIPI